MSDNISRPGPGQGASVEPPPFRYDARIASGIEARWQGRWEVDGTFNAPNPTGPLAGGFDRMAERPKFMIMDMFPYPSGAGLHVGHPLGYIATDVYARYLRMTGHNVLHPFGYDAFGLPAEQYAIDTGQHPAVTTEHNIATMRRQLRRLGLGHDRRRELATTDPGYYRWTQWIFLQIFNSWYDGRAGRARPVPELVAEFASGEREPVGEANPDGLPWDKLSPAQRRQVIAATGSPTSAPSWSTGAPGSVPCWPARRSPPTGAARSATTRCTGGHCGSGCCGSLPMRSA